LGVRTFSLFILLASLTIYSALVPALATIRYQMDKWPVYQPSCTITDERLP
jgi:hypothetical protein